MTELGLSQDQLDMTFETAQEREGVYKPLEKQLSRENKAHLLDLMEQIHQPKLCALQEAIAKGLRDRGFTQVTTPSIISKTFLERMSIDSSHPLNEQVFWLSNKTCLRPMLAPNLYEVSRQLLKLGKTPVRVFEIGSCFRKETEGNAHLKEFTMVNLVEWGLPEEERVSRLKEYAALLMELAQVEDYHLEEEDSVVYGLGLDIVGSNGLELASSSMGPHPLDDLWEIDSSWVGIGSGLERLLMYRERQQGIHRYAKSTAFLDGARLNVK
ncbi:pyrrolysine--tRNA(Pyl) ligase large subunit [Bengtsoniella intestinalis]|uniref:pyrrolysine--tRNA(Pyl) ligase large subunit n=1 Tax=Bengtsoniella intestinalis TaxID=3073143 RepID=UPI00391FCAB0